ncbi:ribonuclease H-like domain-containing protein [Mycena leptocephala]|nr:ribonuclease H-like domain-containing protein [Mycena leptocephala]
MPKDVSDNEQSTGRPRSEVMDHLTVEIESNNPKSRSYRCVGPGCTKVFNPRTVTRVLAHSKRCIKLMSAQRQYASQNSAATSPGARAEELSQGLTVAQLQPPPLAAGEFFGPAGTKQVREHFTALLDLAVVKLFSAAGLPPAVADYPEWKEVFRLAVLTGPRYTPAGRTILMDNHVMSEQECVRGLQLSYLRTQTRLTVSFDGGDVRRGENFYTVHASTCDGALSHTAEWMADMVMDVIKPIGMERFGAASSDNTGNTRGCQRLLCERILTMLNLPDPDHHLNNTISDILRIPYFKLTIKIVRTTVKTFNQSKQSKAMLKQLRLQHSIGRGLETIGKTHFATVTLAAISVQRNLNLISSLCTNGQVEIKKYTSYFIKDTAKSLDFQIKLNQLIAVTEGAAKAIQCLEAASCNPADVYLLWLAVTAHLRVALADSLLPPDVCDEIRGIINHRWREFFVTNPGHGAYLAAFYLNPKYVNSTIFKQPNAVASAKITIPGTRKPPKAPIGVQNAKTFFEVGEYLYELGMVEVEHGIDPVLIAFKKRKSVLATKFKSQFTAYAQGAFPFNTPLGNTRLLKWWQALEGSEHGGIIASLALKLYSAVPHSMADERTVSVITWMNSPLRNQQKVDTIFSFAQIRAYYRDQAKQKTLSEGTAKTHAAARPDPEVKFYNIERDIQGTNEEDDDMELNSEDINEIIDSDDELDVAAATGADSATKSKIDWLDEPRNIVASSCSLNLDSDDCEVNLGSVLLQDVLADQPIPESGSSVVRVNDGDVNMGEEDEEEAAFGRLEW